MAANTDTDLTDDAVIVVPGLMGSELVDQTGHVLWGAADVGWYLRAWTSETGLRKLYVTDDERDGRVGRIRATRLLRTPAFAPLLRGMEPYQGLLAGIRRVVAHPDAVAEFAYDWRLSTTHNAALLAAFAERHLTQWRQHPNGHSQSALVLVAHSMGGLVARYFTGVLGGAEYTRATVTLGTPFYGAAKAVHILACGRGVPVPLPHCRLRSLATTMPSLYDLLPSYRCVDAGDRSRRLFVQDIACIGGDPDLTAAAGHLHQVLDLLPVDRLFTVVGVGQPTVQSVTFEHGTARTHHYVCEQDRQGQLTRVDRRGDGTVYRDAASIAGTAPTHLPQMHAALARSVEALSHVKAVLTRRELGPPLGPDITERQAGVSVADVVAVHQPFEITIDGTDPAGVTCWLTELASGDIVRYPAAVRRDDRLVATVEVSNPGLYRLEVDMDGHSPITELLMALQPADLGPDGEP